MDDYKPNLSWLCGTGLKNPRFSRCTALCGLIILWMAACPRIRAQSVTLTLGSSSLHFPSANPATTASIPAAENPVSALVGFTGIGHWALSVIANGDLTAGGATIPVSKVYWTVSGTGFVGGTMSKTTAQPLSGGALSLLSALGQISFYLMNSWNYATGNYTQTFTITLASF